MVFAFMCCFVVVVVDVTGGVFGLPDMVQNGFSFYL
jgi:hypothetical protein